MEECSGFIVEAMKYIDDKIREIDPKSINRQRLHHAVNKSLVANVKKLIVLEPEEQKKAVDYIFKTQLNEELLK